MSRPLLILGSPFGNLAVDEFAGPRPHGQMLQLTVDDCYVQLTRANVEKLHLTLTAWLAARTTTPPETTP